MAMAIRQSTGILLPIIRRVMPTMIAHQILGVQPMTGSTGSIFGTRRPKFERLNIDQYQDDELLVPEGYCVVDVDTQVYRWVSEQPIHLWKVADRLTFSHLDRMIIADGLYTALALRWM
jgi:hypothetical protein